MILPVWRQFGTTGVVAVVSRPEFVDSQHTRWAHSFRVAETSNWGIGSGDLIHPPTITVP